MAAAVVTALLPVAPVLIQGVEGVVRSVERIFGHGNGGTKKQAALAMSGDLLNIYAATAPAIGLTGAGSSNVQSALSALIDSIVQFYNATGAFVHAQK